MRQRPEGKEASFMKLPLYVYPSAPMKVDMVTLGIALKCRRQHRERRHDCDQQVGMAGAGCSWQRGNCTMNRGCCSYSANGHARGLCVLQPSPPKGMSLQMLQQFA